MLVLLGQFGCAVERRAGLGGLLALEILVAAPATDARDDQERQGDDQERVPVPQLLELIATDILVDFIK